MNRGQAWHCERFQFVEEPRDFCKSIGANALQLFDRFIHIQIGIVGDCVEHCATQRNSRGAIARGQRTRASIFAPQARRDVGKDGIIACVAGGRVTPAPSESEKREVALRGQA